MTKAPRKSVQKNHPNGVQINMLMTVEEVEELQREVRRRQEENPGVRMSRAVVARDLVLRALRDTKESREGRRLIAKSQTAS